MIFGREPALFSALLGAGINLGIAFGLHLSDIQLAAVNTFLFAVVGFVTRAASTPNAKLNGAKP